MTAHILLRTAISVIAVLLASAAVALPLLPTTAPDPRPATVAGDADLHSPAEEPDERRSRRVRRSLGVEGLALDEDVRRHLSEAASPLQSTDEALAAPSEPAPAEVGGARDFVGGAPPTGPEVDEVGEATRTRGPEVVGEVPDASAPAAPESDEVADESPSTATDDGAGPWQPALLGPEDFGVVPQPPPVFDLVGDGPVQLGPGAKAVATNDLYVDVGCAGDCVTHATAAVASHDAAFDVKTNTPARIRITVDGIGTKDSGTRTTHWTVAFDGLAPGMTYPVALFAEDEHGHVTHHQGSIATQQRHVAVTFTQVQVHRTRAKEQIEFHFFTNGTWHHELHEPERKIKAGQWAAFDGKTVVLEDAPQHLAVRVQGAERRSRSEGLGVKFCGEYQLPGFFDGEFDCHWVATAWLPSTTGVDLDALGDGNALPGGHALVMDSYAIGLEFTAYVHLTVWYA